MIIQNGQRMQMHQALHFGHVTAIPRRRVPHGLRLRAVAVATLALATVTFTAAVVLWLVASLAIPDLSLVRVGLWVTGVVVIVQFAALGVTNRLRSAPGIRPRRRL